MGQRLEMLEKLWSRFLLSKVACFVSIKIKKDSSLYVKSEILIVISFNIKISYEMFRSLKLENKR